MKKLTNSPGAKNYLFCYLFGMISTLCLMMTSPVLALEFVDTTTVPATVVQTQLITPPVIDLPNIMMGPASIKLIQQPTVLPDVIDVEPVQPAPTPAPEPVEPPFNMTDHYGEAVFTEPNGSGFTKLDLPTKYYPGIDFSYFKAWMPYTVLGKNNQCGRIAYSDQAFTDENGLRRYNVQPGEFNVDGQADYLVAMSTYYKPKGTIGQRYLVVAETGSYTVKTSDELADVHSDQHHMFSRHGEYATILEFLVDSKTLDRSAKRMGTVSAIGGLLSEDIIHLYLIS